MYMKDINEYLIDIVIVIFDEEIKERLRKNCV